MDSTSPTFRSDLMRQIAQLEEQIDLLFRSEKHDDKNREKQRELKRQIDELWRKMLA